MALTDSAPAAGQKAAQAQPKKKGPAVWLDMDQAELDAAYDQSKYAPNQALVQARRVVLSQRARTALGGGRTVGHCHERSPFSSVMTYLRIVIPRYINGGA